jgi:pantoate--beta-alanine ligase
MGYLHEGHLSLLDRAAELADTVALSLYVNPLQFGPQEDLDRYPRDLDRDLTLAAERGVHLVFTPDTKEMYGAGAPEVTVDPGRLGDRLCGAYRPGHFRGVLTVVAKLLVIFTPDVAIFGQKDFQQAVLIRRMVRELDLPVSIDVVPTVREVDGLALSSRNAYLSAKERSQAAGIHRSLRAALEAYRAGERGSRHLVARFDEEVARYSLVRPQYREIVDPEDLSPVDPIPVGAVLAVAAHVGETRLIDNVVLD